MPLLRSLSVSAQAAAHIRAELERGRWTGFIPGVHKLAAELGINRKTIEAALHQLEHEGLLAGQGQGKRRQIQLSAIESGRSMRVELLLYEPCDKHLDYIVELQHALAQAGHTVIISPKSLIELKMNPQRISRLVDQSPAEAWIIMSASREVVAWFSQQSKPVFALFGRVEGQPIAAAGPNKGPAFAAAARHLISLGHSRIVLVARRGRRLPELGRSESAFVQELRDHNIPISDFNLPDWEESREGLHKVLISLFQFTPPTALLVEEAPIFAAVQQFLASEGLRVPQQVSLICTDDDPNFAWSTPPISHIRWHADRLVRHIVRWASRISQGQEDIRQIETPAEFVIGGTVGPPMLS